MERFTEKLTDRRNVLRGHHDEIFNPEYGHFIAGEAVDKLAEYEDLEEQGLLLRLPCNIGDTVYVIAPNYEKCKHKTECEDYDSEEFLFSWCKVYCRNGYKGMGVIPTIVKHIEVRETGIYIFTEYGYRNVENFFLTQAEAEQKLKEMESD